MLWHIYSVKLCHTEMTPSTAPSYSLQLHFSAKCKYLFSFLKGRLSCSSLFAVFPQVVWINGSWALNCWLCSEPWCSLVVRHKESSLGHGISGPWLYGCLFCLFKRRSKSDKKLIFSLVCTYPLYYVNTDSKRNSCSCNNPNDLMLPWCILTLGDCLLKTMRVTSPAASQRCFYVLAMRSAVPAPLKCVCHLKNIESPAEINSLSHQHTLEHFAGGKPGSFTPCKVKFFLPRFPSRWPVPW